MEQAPPPDRQAALKDLAGKSWNLELIISGAAIVLTAQLPDLVDDMFYYYHFNLSYDWDSGASYLPVLAFAFFKTVAYLMTAMFLVHLAMRAFWVAMVGLQAAFPEGIRYGQVPNMSPGLREYQEQKFGKLEDYILRLDRLCNQVLAFAFLVGLMGVGIGILYNLFFGLAQITRALFSPSTIAVLYRLFVGCSLLLAVFIIGLSVFTKLKPRMEPRFLPWTKRFYSVISAVLLPFIYRPINYLTLTFVSNLARRRYYVSMVLVMIFVMCSVFVVFIEKIGDLKGRHLLEWRDYYASGAPATELVANRYDNLRVKQSDLPPVSLPSDVVDGPFLPVFVLYPKMLDRQLTQICPLPELPDSLSRQTRLMLTDSLRLACLSGFYRLYVNDSLYARPDWMFSQKPGAVSRGLTTYLPTGGFRPGKNLITVKVPVTSKPDSLRVFGVVPFWYAPH